MTNTLKGFAALSLFLLIGAGCNVTTNTPTDIAPTSDTMVEDHTSNNNAMKDNDAQQDDAMMEDTDSTKDDSAMMEDKKDDTVMESGAMVAGSYEAYSPDKLSRANNGDVVLFFHAGWCPSCRALDKSIEASRSEIPDGLHILKLDYDKEKDLKKKYGVTTQHTLVQVDGQGNLIKKWSGGNNLASITTQVQ